MNFTIINIAFLRMRIFVIRSSDNIITSESDTIFIDELIYICIISNFNRSYFSSPPSPSNIRILPPSSRYVCNILNSSSAKFARGPPSIRRLIFLNLSNVIFSFKRLNFVNINYVSIIFQIFYKFLKTFRTN